MENKPIVVGVDGSAASYGAVRWAAREAAIRSTRLLLLCCVDDDLITLSDYPIPDAYFDLLNDRADKDLAEALALATTEADDAGTDIGIDKKRLLCEPRLGLQRMSEGADLLVVGAEGQTPRAPGVLGRVADALTSHAACPVVVVRDHPGPAREATPEAVVVGVDGSRSGELAVRLAYEEAALRNTRLVAVHAWNVTKLHPLFKGEHSGLSWDDAKTAEEAVLSEALAGYREKYPDVEVTTQVPASDPVGALRDASADAALLVVGSRGRSNFIARVLGSTSRALLNTASCPVLIARP